MKTRYIIFAIILVIILAVIYYQRVRLHLNLTSVTVPSTSDLHPTRNWNVVNDYPNKTEAADRIAKVHSIMIEFMRYLKKKYHIDETDDVIATEGDSHKKAVEAPNDIYNMVGYLLDNYNPEVFYENDPRYSSDTSYTLNKGSAMYVCVRDKSDPNKLVDEDTLLFVMLHEAAHIANYRGWGHDTQYWTVFKWLLHEAVESGVYKPVNYDLHPVMFCGLSIYFQPLYDKGLKNLWES